MAALGYFYRGTNIGKVSTGIFQKLRSAHFYLALIGGRKMILKVHYSKNLKKGFPSVTIKLNELLIIDLECTCWATSQKPPDESQEIIEIGICKFDLKSWSPISKHQIIVKPIQSKVSGYCSALTGWTQKDLDNSEILLSDACKTLTTVYNTKQRVWASWGDYDRLQFFRECRRKDINYPFSYKHMNLKTLFAIHEGLNKELGMAEALNRCGLTLEGRHHKGVDDAWNVGRILAHQGRF